MIPLNTFLFYFIYAYWDYGHFFSRLNCGFFPTMNTSLFCTGIMCFSVEGVGTGPTAEAQWRLSSHPGTAAQVQTARVSLGSDPGDEVEGSCANKWRKRIRPWQQCAAKNGVTGSPQVCVEEFAKSNVARGNGLWGPTRHCQRPPSQHTKKHSLPADWSLSNYL